MTLYTLGTRRLWDQGGARHWTGTSNFFLNANLFQFVTLGFFMKKKHGGVLNFLRLNCLEYGEKFAKQSKVR